METLLLLLLLLPLSHCSYDAQNMEITRHIWNEYGTDNLSLFGVLLEYEKNMTGANNTFVLGSFIFLCQYSVDEHLFNTRVKFGYLLESAYFLQLFYCGLLGFQHHLLYRTMFSVAFFNLPKVGKYTAHTLVKHSQWDTESMIFLRV